MVDQETAAAILKRALAYPYATPERSYLYRDGEALEPPPGGFDRNGRAPLISYGANSSPEALARKLAPLPELDLPLERVELEGFDVVYSAHVSPYGAVPATLHESPGTTAPVFIAYPTPPQQRLLTAGEPNYDLVELRGYGVYRSKHGCLLLDGSPVALAAVHSRGRTLPELDEPEVLERVRAHLEPEMTLERFVHACVERGGIRPLRIGARRPGR